MRLGRRPIVTPGRGVGEWETPKKCSHLLTTPYVCTRHPGFVNVVKEYCCVYGLSTLVPVCQLWPPQGHRDRGSNAQVLESTKLRVLVCTGAAERTDE